ncbi:hypothetical protein EMIT013CA1_70136 [Bacillus sp. IT-13CA1]
MDSPFVYYTSHYKYVTNYYKSKISLFYSLSYFRMQVIFPS